MNSFPCWVWRFSPAGRFEFGRCRDGTHWRRLRSDGWAQVNPSVVSKRLHMLATLYQQENLYLTYRERHARPELAMEPENFQVIYKGTGDPSFYSPVALSDIAQAFAMPITVLLAPTLRVIPRPFDGISTRRWDRMGTLQPTTSMEQAQTQAKRTPQSGVRWFMYGRGEDTTAFEVAQQEGCEFHFIHRVPRLYVVSYELGGTGSELIVVEHNKKRAEETLLALHPDAIVVSTVSAPALPGLAFDVTKPQT